MSNTNFRVFGGEGGHPNYRANQDKATVRPATGGRFAADVTQCCCYCGKTVKNGHGETFLLLSALNEIITQAEYRDGDLGLYPIGSDCAKKAKKAGVKVYNWDGEEV